MVTTHRIVISVSDQNHLFIPLDYVESEYQSSIFSGKRIQIDVKRSELESS